MTYHDEGVVPFDSVQVGACTCAAERKASAPAPPLYSSSLLEMTSATGWSWGSAWGDDALDEQEDEAGGRVKRLIRMRSR